MTKRALINRVKKLKALEAQYQELSEQIEVLKDEIKTDMEAKGAEWQEAGDFLVRWTKVIGKRFDSRAFQKEHAGLYEQYLKQTESRRFSIT